MLERCPQVTYNAAREPKAVRTRGAQLVGWSNVPAGVSVAIHG